MELFIEQQRGARIAPQDMALAAVAERIEQRAWQDVVAAAPGWVRTATGLIAERQEDVLLIASRGIPNLLLNRVIGLGQFKVATHAHIDRIMDRYWDLGIAEYWVHVGPHVRPARLSSLLQQHGLQPYPRSWAKMIRSALRSVESVDSSVRVRRARLSDAPLVASILGNGLDFPQIGAELFSALIERDRWTVLVGEVDDRVVAAGALFIEGAMAHLPFAAVRPEFRGRGAHPALLAERIRLASAAGCQWIATETGFPLAADEPNPSYENMIHAGFRPVALREIFAPPGTRWGTD